MARAYIVPGGRAIDATAGNGHDTEFLARAVGPGGTVLAVDLQEDAVRATRTRLEEAGMGARCRVVCADHAGLRQLGASEFLGATAVILFNLGWLPGGDHTVITRTDSTLSALEASLGLLAVGGLLAVTVYPGHVGGDTEASAVEAWMRTRSVKQYRCSAYKGMNTPPTAPYALFLERLR